MEVAEARAQAAEMAKIDLSMRLAQMGEVVADVSTIPRRQVSGGGTELDRLQQR